MQEQIISVLESIDSHNIQKFSLKGTETYAKITEVHDGDSVTAILTCDSLNNTLYKWKCRIYGVDTPELKSPIGSKERIHAIQARDYLRGIILGKIVRVKCYEFDKYGRLLISINLLDNSDNSEKDVSKLLITHKFGHTYSGGTKEKWSYD